MKISLLTLVITLFGTLSLCFSADREHTLKIYNWADYIDEDLLEEFKTWYFEQTGEKVELIYQLFDINEVMLSKIEKGKEDFDVICPSDYIIERMLRADLLLPINKGYKDTLKFTGNVSPYIWNFLSQIEIDGKNASDYAVPYMWGTVGLTYNTAYLSAEEVSTWKILADPRLQGKVLMKDAFRDVYTTFNLALNYDKINSGELSLEEVCNDVSPESIEKVEAFLNEMKPNILGWEVDFGREMMTKEKAWLNMNWSGDAMWAIIEAQKVGVSLDYILPKEGSIVWFDAWAIPKYAKNIQAARYFIDFMCTSENAIRNMEAVGYVSAVAGEEILAAMVDSTTFEPLDAEYFFGERGKNACLNPIMYPDASVMERCGMMHDLGTEELLAMWSRVKGDNANALTIIVIVTAVVVILTTFVLSSRKKKRSIRAKVRR